MTPPAAAAAGERAPPAGATESSVKKVGRAWSGAVSGAWHGLRDPWRGGQSASGVAVFEHMKGLWTRFSGFLQPKRSYLLEWPGLDY